MLIEWQKIDYQRRPIGKKDLGRPRKSWLSDRDII